MFRQLRAMLLHDLLEPPPLFQHRLKRSLDLLPGPAPAAVSLSRLRIVSIPGLEAVGFSSQFELRTPRVVFGNGVALCRSLRTRIQKCKFQKSVEADTLWERLSQDYQNP